VHQPDCPVVEASAKVPGVRLEAISSRASGQYVLGFLSVETSALREALAKLRSSRYTVRAEVLSKGARSSVISITLRQTRLMSLLSGDYRLLWFAPLYALDGYEYWLVISSTSTRRLREALEAGDHEVRVVSSVAYPGAYLGVALAVYSCIRLSEVARRGSSEGSRVVREILSGSTLGRIAREYGYSKSYLSRKRKEVLEVCRSVVDALGSVLQSFGEPG